MPNERRGDQNVGDCREGEPDDDDDLELHEPSKLWDHPDGDGCTQPAACDMRVDTSVRSTPNS